jgi:amidase
VCGGVVYSRVAVLAEPPGGSTHPGVAAAVRAAADALADDGFEIAEATPPDYELALELWATILAADVRIIKPLLDQFMGADGQRYLGNTLDVLPDPDLAGLATAQIA